MTWKTTIRNAVRGALETLPGLDKRVFFHDVESPSAPRAVVRILGHERFSISQRKAGLMCTLVTAGSLRNAHERADDLEVKAEEVVGNALDALNVAWVYERSEPDQVTVGQEVYVAQSLVFTIIVNLC